MTEKETFEGWCIVELFGHSEIAGFVSEQSIAGQPFVRVDVPGDEKHKPFTKFYGGGAIYAITPTTEEIATLAAQRLSVRPVEPWIVPVPDTRRQLPEQIVDPDADATYLDHADDDWVEEEPPF